MTINNFLTKQFNFSNKEALSVINRKLVLINGEIAKHRQFITEKDAIVYNKQVVQKAKNLFYYAYYKPVGIESTLNLDLPNNLVQATSISDYFFPIGRLDKASEGLMILTNDGQLYKEIIDVTSTKEKNYEVEVEQEVTDDFIRKMSTGVMIMGSYTKPCEVLKMASNKFKITLIEGRNRQIRRMCYKLGYEVLVLKRTRIGKLALHDLKEGAVKAISKNSIV